MDVFSDNHLGNTLAGVVGALLIRRIVGFQDPLASAKGVLALVGGGALLATTVSATIGVSTLVVTGAGTASDVGPLWLTWWLGDAVGVIVVTPLFLAWRRPFSFTWRYWRFGEGIALVVALMFTAQLVFGGWFVTGSNHYPLAFLTLPLLIWATFRFGPRGATSGIAVMATLATWGTALGFGPFAHDGLNESLLLLQAFMAVTTTTTLMLVAVIQERRHAHRQLEHARNEMDRQVRERTWELSETNGYLLREIEERSHVQEQLRHLAHHDPLTNVANRLLFDDRLEHGLQQARRSDQRLALLFADIDGFKRINDELGHSVGDELLQQVAQRLVSSVRECDTVARLGGDEFTVLLERVDSLENAREVVQRIQRAISEPFIIGEHELLANVSVGMSIFPQDGKDVGSLMRNADTAMYKAKKCSQKNHHSPRQGLAAAGHN